MDLNEQYNEDMTQMRPSRLGRSRGKGMSLQMLPMIDVIFLLLAFFVLTAKFRVPEDYLALKLPTGQENSDRFAIIEPLEIEITQADAGCSITIGGVETTLINEETIEHGLAAFAMKFKYVAESQKRYAGDPVEIRCDDKIEWDYLVKIYNLLQAMGMSDITFHMNE